MGQGEGNAPFLFGAFATVCALRYHPAQEESPLIKLFAALLTAALLGALPAAGQDWPQRAVHIISPFGPGSTPDVVARILANNLNKRTGKPFIVENRAGAGGMIGTDAIAKATPDGYTIGMGTLGPLVNNTLMSRKMNYDPFRDLTPITLAVSQPSVVAVNAEFKANNLRDLFAEMKRAPGKYNYASIGNGSLSHLAMVLIADRSGVDMVHVVYPGSGQAIPALIAGQVHMAVLPALVVLPQAKAGKLKMLAIMRRSALLPELPSLREEGIINFETDTWFGVVGPAKLPKPLLDQIHAELVRTLREPEVAQALRNQLMEVVASSSEEFARTMQEELSRWKPVVEKAAISID
jgi:tripartite-type tricarboxylate transporter receptor subunit TctC